MKKIFFAAAAVLSALTLSSCSDFLETQPTSSVSDSQVFTTISGAQGALNGCYYILDFEDLNYGRGDVNGYVSHLMTFDSCGEDIIVKGGWYCYDYNMWGHQRGDIFKTYCLWYYYYLLINNVNSVIAYTPAIEGAAQADINAIVGQALAIRGWAYFNLIQLFQQTYAVASPKGMPGVPLYTEPSSDQTEGKGRGTIDETYAQIISDLTAAEEMLAGFSRQAKNHFDQSVVRGVLAHVYLVMGNWAKAGEYAAKARAGYPLTSNEEYYLGFNDISTKSWMWGMKQDTENQLMGDGAYGPFALWTNYIVRDGDAGGWSFNCFFLNDKFVNLFTEGDIRLGQIHWNDGLALHLSDKFYDNSSLCGDFVFMRSEDMLLIEAEADARQGKEAEALTLLNELQSLRGAKLSASTGEALVEDILIERRKELYGEGYAWYDIIRNQKALVRDGNHENFGGAKSFPARSWRFVYQIPTSEIQNNPNINSDTWPTAGAGQNPYGLADGSLVLE